MKEKYIENEFPPYFEFGVHPDGRVDLANEANDLVATVSKEHADNLIQDREKMLMMLIKLATRLDELAPEEFDKVWYT